MQNELSRLKGAPRLPLRSASRFVVIVKLLWSTGNVGAHLAFDCQYSLSFVSVLLRWSIFYTSFRCVGKQNPACCKVSNSARLCWCYETAMWITTVAKIFNKGVRWPLLNEVFVWNCVLRTCVSLLDRQTPVYGESCTIRWEPNELLQLAESIRFAG